jgi:hypothetical protein
VDRGRAHGRALLVGERGRGLVGGEPPVDPGWILAGRPLGQLEQATGERLFGLDEAGQAEAEVEVGWRVGRARRGLV